MKYVVLLLILLVFLSGCVGQTPTAKIFRDPITIPDESYIISPRDPYADSTVNMNFEVHNLGTQTVDEVELYFIPSNFEVITITCSSPSQTIENGCVLSNMEKNDVRIVSVVLKAPSKDIIKSPTNMAVRYQLKYDYTGYRNALIPVVDDITVKQPKNPYTPSNPSDGPIELEFEPPKQGEIKKGKQVIDLRWVKKDIPFELKMKLNHVGSKDLGTVKNLIIPVGQLKIDMDGVDLVRIDSEELSCDLKQYGNSLVSEEDIEVPSELSCNLISTKQDFRGFYNMKLEASFSYTYIITKTEEFTVRPRS